MGISRFEIEIDWDNRQVAFRQAPASRNETAPRSQISQIRLSEALRPGMENLCAQWGAEAALLYARGRTLEAKDRLRAVAAVCEAYDIEPPFTGEPT